MNYINNYCRYNPLTAEEELEKYFQDILSQRSDQDHDKYEQVIVKMSKLGLLDFLEAMKTGTYLDEAYKRSKVFENSSGSLKIHPMNNVNTDEK